MTSYETSVCLNHLTQQSAREEFVESKSCHATGTVAEAELNNEDRYPTVDLTYSLDTLQEPSAWLNCPHVAESLERMTVAQSRWNRTVNYRFHKSLRQLNPVLRLVRLRLLGLRVLWSVLLCRDAVKENMLYGLIGTTVLCVHTEHLCISIISGLSQNNEQIDKTLPRTL